MTVARRCRWVSIKGEQYYLRALRYYSLRVAGPGLLVVQINAALSV
jgi:hypothetical protein